MHLNLPVCMGQMNMRMHSHDVQSVVAGGTSRADTVHGAPGPLHCMVLSPSQDAFVNTLPDSTHYQYSIILCAVCVRLLIIPAKSRALASLVYSSGHLLLVVGETHQCGRHRHRNLILCWTAPAILASLSLLDWMLMRGVLC